MSVYLLGEVALWVGLGLALYGAILGHVGGRRGDPRLVDAALGSVYGTATCVAFAYLLLTAGFLNDEFRLAYVADNASRAMPPWYKATAVWGGMEGSMLLWALILAGYSTAAIRVHRRRQPELAPHAAAVLQSIMAFFLGVMVFSSRPFAMLDFTPPGFLAIGVLALLLGVTMWLQFKLNPAAMDPAQQQIFMIMPWS